jgi:hypothetical protein
MKYTTKDASSFSIQNAQKDAASVCMINVQLKMRPLLVYEMCNKIHGLCWEIKCAKKDPVCVV